MTWLLAAASLQAVAQTSVSSVVRDAAGLIKAGQSISAYGGDLFGDSVNLYTGALTLTHTAVSLPGNHGLPVAVVRTFAPRDGAVTSGAFGDWDLALPSIGGQFATGSTNKGWSVLNATGTANQNKRCSFFGEPDWSTAPGSTTSFEGFEYWQGTQLSLPGGGGGEVLARSTTNTVQPADGNTWPLVTKSGWALRCLPSLHASNLNTTPFAVGEGFIALSPDGTTYRFDWLVIRPTKPAIKVINHQSRTLPRSDIAILPTLVTDRFGNTVTYNYNPSAPTQLTSIVASDGRQLSFTYVAGSDRIQSVTDGTRTWTYGYTAGSTSYYTGVARATNYLSSVTQPDGSAWGFALQPLHIEATSSSSGCVVTSSGNDRSGTVSHPSGAVATFTTRNVVHGRRASGECTSAWDYKSGAYVAAGWSWFPFYWAARALVAKSISGPGLSTMNWSWAYPAAQGGGTSCTTCPTTKTVSVTDPRGYVTRHTYGIHALVNEGQLLQLDEAWNGTSALRTTNFAYRASDAGPYPSPAGYSGNPRSDALQSLYHAPLSQRTTTLQGTTFTWQASSFDVHARPLAVTRSSSLGYSKTETTAYFDHLAKWVLGQVASVSVGSAVPTSTAYHATTALPTSRSEFGRVVETYAWNTDGTLYQRIDPAGRATTYSNYLRGVPRTVAHPDGTSDTATVNNLGWVTGITNAAGTTTSYGYDAMGRIASITHPNETGLAYHPTTQVFEKVAAAEVGIAANHWRQTVSTGNARTVRYFDALWRERLAVTWDTANPTATRRATETRYDADSRKVFQSVPSATLALVDQAVPGTAWAHDGLGRVFGQYQDSELGVLTTSTSYLAGFQKRVTNPRGHDTTFSHQAYDQPDDSLIVAASAPEGVSLTIGRDAFGKPQSITRSGASLSATRAYVYDAHQRLCKTVEPESGATVQAYDTAGNTAWRASGTTLTGTTACDQASVPANRQIAYGYDSRNRLTGTTYGDGSPSVGRSYTADGLPYQVWSNGSTWTYSYNNRRLMTAEALTHSTGTYTFGHGIDAYGQAASLTYPGGLSVAYAPNALGQPTGAGPYASGVTHHPNGAMAGYTLGNGIAHTTTLTARGLPSQWRDAGVLQDQYAWDANGNVASIADQQEGLTSRSMGYDALDRLTSASGIWGTGSYGYDALDNLRTSTVGGRTAVATLDSANRLAGLTVNGVAQSYGYDANGNLTARGSQAFSFDIGNRLSSAPGKASYAYDGHGRRTWVAYADGSWKLQVYGGSGKLLYTNHSSQGNTRHVYLGSRLIAEDNSVSGTSYSHTDALGSPVARTNSAGQVTSRTRYEPYGATAAGTNPTGIGFTGHVNDADTGLVYMQQRYYEPVAGRFLSVDPVVTDANGGSFNRYLYANGNPYRYVDPDGRQSQQPTPGEEEKKKQKEADKKKEEEAKGVRYVRTLWLRGDEGSPESDSQGLSNTAGDQLGMTFFRSIPGPDLIGCLAGTCTTGDLMLAGLAVAPQLGPAAKGAIYLWPAASGGRTVINGLEYTIHAIERMQPVGTIFKGGAMFSRGVPPSAVENAVRLGKVTPGNNASEVVRTFENVRVITNPEGTRVISVIKIGS